MSTKWYIYSTAPSFSPSAHQGSWNVDASGDSDRFMSFSPTRTGVAISTKSRQKTSASVQTLLGCIAVSEPLAAQTLSLWSLDGVLRVGESATSMDAFMQFHIYITQGDTNSVRGTLLDNYTHISEMSTANQGKSFGIPDISGLSINEGDRLVIEFGAKSNSLINSQITTLAYGGTSTSNDLTSGSASTVNPGYVIVSQTLKYYKKKELTASGFVFVPTTVTGTGVVQSETTKEATSTGIVQSANTKEITGTALVAETIAKTFDTDGRVVNQHTSDFTATSTIAGEFEKEFSADGHVTLGIETHKEITGTGNVFGTYSKDFQATSIIKSDRILEFNANAITQAESTKDFTSDGLVKYQITAEFTGDAYSIISTNKQVTWTATALAVLAIPKVISFDATGYISQYPEIYCDAIITNEISSSGLVRLNSGSWTDNDWRVTYVEQTNGNQFLNTTFLTPYTFVAGFDANITHIGLCLDISSVTSFTVDSIPQLATLGIKIKDFSGTVVSDNTYGNTYWEDIQAPLPTPGWFAFELQTPVSAIGGSSYTLEIVPNEYSPTLLTTAVVNNYEIIRRDLNCLVITDQSPVDIETRPSYVLPTVVDDTAMGYTLSSGTLSEINSLVVGPKCTFATTPNENLSITVSSIIQVQSNATFSVKPDSGKQHKFKFAVGAGMQFFGQLETEGNSKTRYAKSNSVVTGNQKTITLDRSPVNWLPNDLVYLNNPGFPGGLTGTIENVIGNQLILKSGLGLTQVNAGAYVVNISRDVMFTGESNTARGGLVFKGDGESSISKTAFRYMGGSSCIKGQEETTIALDDVVISGMLNSTVSGDVGVYADEHIVSTTTLGVFDTGSAATVITEWEADVLLGGLTDTHSGIRLKSTMKGTVEALNTNGGILGMYDSARFIGSIILLTSPSNSSLACCVSGVAHELYLTDSICNISLGAAITGVLRMRGGGIGNVVFENITTNTPYVFVEESALFLGSGRASNCISTASRPVTMSTNTFINFKDEDNVNLYTTPVSVMDTGSLVPGSEIATRYFSAGSDGYRYIQGDVVDTGASSLRLVSTGESYRMKLADIAVNVGETLVINLRVQGELELILESAIAPDVSTTCSSVSFDTFSATTTSTSAGVISVYVSTTSEAYIDGLVRGN